MKTQNKLVTLLLTSLVFFSSWASAGTWGKGEYTGVFGKRSYRVYVPNNLSRSSLSSLVVMLHGCDQSADAFATGSRIEKWADKEKFIALFPQQSKSYNPFACWNWSLPGNNSRFGEPQVIVEMIDDVAKRYDIDLRNVFAAGMSSGASMASILGNCYPERFKAVASHDGTQYLATATGLDFASVVLSGATVSSDVAAFAGFGCSYFTKNKPKKMPIIIFHGMNSPLMSPVHAFQIESEFQAFNDYLDNGLRDNSYFRLKEIKNIPESNTYGYTLYTTVDEDNDVIIERYMINKLGHDWSGGAEGKYNDPKGPDATGLMIDFFKRYGL